MLLTLPAALERIVRDLRDSGFHAVIVGGSVRDALLGHQPKDIDLEVYRISYDELAAFLATRGRVDLVGKSFGVVKFTESGAVTCDFSVPRRDSKTGPGHRDFNAHFDASITPREAASRRDFTINAMSFDPLTGVIWDFFGGQVDLNNRVLRATSDAFSEDPLRVLRGMQFACRFNLTVDAGTAAMSRSIAGEYSTLARERVAEEFMKWAVKSPHPGRIAEYLQSTGWIVHFPEIQNLFGVPQDPEWHPEGDVGVHTMHVLNEAARIAERDALPVDDRAVLLFAALSHDFAKPSTTELREREGRVRWTSWGHEPAGGPMARAFLNRIGIKAAIVDQVVKLVESHLAHHSIGREVTPRAVRRLALRLAPASITQLVRVIEADASGRPPLEPGVPPAAQRLLAAAESEAVDARPQPPLILGRHVLPYFNDRPGVHIGEVTTAAYEAQADGAFSTEEEALRWLNDFMAQRLQPGGRE
ncbi:MAG TPA: HD domain-containing protein [Bryobacteraceae bacterium]|nr:HD domain-containing protein [Bryobacteraceae bacterium]